MKHILWMMLVLSQLTCCSQQSSYVCPPCHADCDSLTFETPGTCHACGMKLIRKQDKLETKEFSFTFGGTRYSAEIANLKDVAVKGTIVLIPGHGQTDFVGGGQFYGLRQFFGRQGLATLVWDKKGCGKSEGTYEHHQSVQSSADEALAAIRAFRESNSPESKTIGLWGISRGGWICPLIINGDKAIKFWISVSGTDQFDSFRYMIETNLTIEGRSPDQVARLLREYDHYMRTVRKGGESYQQLLQSTQSLFNDPFVVALGERPLSEADFKSAAAYYATSTEQFDPQTGVRVMVPGFEEVLRNINCPVLAIFGELDSQVDWRKTRALYQRTIGANPKSSLDMTSLPGCNHNMTKSITGGRFEKSDQEVCDGYYLRMQNWLRDNVPVD